MKNIYLMIFAGLVLASCDKLGKDDSSTLDGDTDIPMNSVDNTLSASISFGSNYVYASADVVESNDGIVTLNVYGTVPEDFPLKDILPDEYVDASGNFDTEIQFKNTSEGILDYINADSKPFVLVKYDAKVGDKWECEKSDGSKITRKVTAKSTTDDYSYGFYLIKTITVEQDSRIPGVTKIVYNANHKFGLVGVDVYLEDGDVIHSSVYSQYNVSE
jgi:hypothetical protein